MARSLHRWARAMSRALTGRWRMRSPRCARALTCALALLCAFALCMWWGAGQKIVLGRGPALRRLPLAYWMYKRDHPDRFYDQSSSCMSPPTPLQIQYSAGYWQVVSPAANSANIAEYEDSDGGPQILVMAAYWDARVSPAQARLIVHSDEPLPILYCHFWYYHTGISQRTMVDGWKSTGRSTGSRLVSCPVPAAPHQSSGRPLGPSEAAPVAVSVERDVPCGRATTMLLLQDTPAAPPDGIFQWSARASPAGPRPASVCVCAVWRRRGDAAPALTEWLLMLHRMVVDRVYVYLPEAHENVLKVLEYFSLTHGPLVELTPFDAGDDAAAMLDCFYRARAQHAWVAVLDLDTMLMPVRDRTLPNFVAVSVHEYAGGGGIFGDTATRGPNLHINRGHLGVSGVSRGVNTGALGPDVLLLRRFIFPAALQDERPPLRAGRILDHLWREPQPLDPDYEHMTGLLLNTATVVTLGTVGANLSCVSACRHLSVAAMVARAHVYQARCGGRGRRGRCRAGRSRQVVDAVRDRVARRWDVARRVNHTLRALRLTPRRHTELDDQ